MVITSYCKEIAIKVEIALCETNNKSDFRSLLM